jgi:hypothetical protein
LCIEEDSGLEEAVRQRQLRSKVTHRTWFVDLRRPNVVDRVIDGFGYAVRRDVQLRTLGQDLRVGIEVIGSAVAPPELGLQADT